MKSPPESFIHNLWMKKLIPSIGLQTISGKSIQILDYGELNTIGGPDIFNTKIKIGETIWAGNVEIHVNASDWYKHNHQNDTAYKNVILHVVYNHDKAVVIENNKVESLELPKELCERHFISMNKLLHNATGSDLPCSSLLSDIPNFIIEQWKTRLLSERIESKLEVRSSKTDVYNFVWSVIMESFGMKYNKNPMKLMAENIDFRSFKSFSLKEIQTELLFLSGLKLPIQMPKKDHLESGESIIPEWKFGGIRPMNQPVIKLMQFGAFLHQVGAEILDLIENANFSEINKILENIRVSSYWETHSSFYTTCKQRKIVLGKTFHNHLTINAIIPLFYHLNLKLKGVDVSEDIFDYYDKLPKEENRITRKMVENGFQNKSGFDSQSLIQLNNFYCQRKKCLNCAIGNKILS